MTYHESGEKRSLPGTKMVPTKLEPDVMMIRPEAALRARRDGFTLIELIVVLIIGVIMTGMAVPNMTRMIRAKNAQTARDQLVWMAAKARAKSIERGQVWKLEIFPATEKARVIQTGATVATDSINFSTQFKTTISTVANTQIDLCFSPRGFAFSCSANSPAANVDVTFLHIEKTAVARIKPLGQVQRL